MSSTRSRLPGAAVAATLLVLLAVSYWAAAAETPFPVGFWSDDATYVSTARSLAQGTGYRHIQTPGEPLQTRYPPLYPALLSLAFHFGHDYPANWRLLLIPGAAAAAALWLMSVAYWRRVFEAPATLLWCAGALALASPVVLAFSRYTMSDLVYGALSLAAMLCLDRRGRPVARRETAALIGGAVFIALSILTRSIGVVLLPAALIGLLAQRRWSHAGILLAVVLACCAPWWVWQLHASAANGELQTALMTSAELNYGLWLPEHVPQLVEVLRQNALRILFAVANYQLALPLSGIRSALEIPSWRTVLLFGVAGIAFGSCAVGFIASSRRRGQSTRCWTILHIYLLLYGGVVWLWPFEPHRFLVPWTPFILYFLLAGVLTTASRVGSFLSSFGGRVPQALVALTALAIGSLFLVEDARIVASRSDALFVRELGGGFDADELAEAHAFIEREIPATEIIASAGPGGVYLHSGRRGYFVWPDTNPYLRYYGADREAWRFYSSRSRNEMLSIYDEMAAQLPTLYGELGIRFYLHQPNWLESRVLDEIAANRPGIFEPLFESSGGAYRLYRVKGLTTSSSNGTR